MNADNFQCAECLQVFKKARSDEETKEEFEALFPAVPIEETAVVCDDCFKKIIEGLSH